MNILKILLISLVLAYFLLVGIIYIKQRDMLYHPSKQVHELSYYNLDNTEEITIITKDNVALQAWYHPASLNHEMIIFLHGNSGNLEDRVPHLRELIEMGYGFIIPAWRGFGKSEGLPSLNGLLLDAQAAIHFLQTKHYPLDKIIIVGESLGTSIATQITVEHKFKGLFLITPYTSIADRAGEIYPFLPTQLLTKDNFKVLDNIDKINQPLLMIHGDQDIVVPYQHSEKIFTKAHEPKKLIIYPGIGHNNYSIKEAFTEMKNFFSQF